MVRNREGKEVKKIDVATPRHKMEPPTNVQEKIHYSMRKTAQGARIRNFQTICVRNQIIFPNQIYLYLYLHDFPNPNIIRICIWFKVWKPINKNFAQSQIVKFSVVIKGTEDPVCNFHCSKLS